MVYSFDPKERRLPDVAPHTINLSTKSLIYGSRTDDFTALLNGLDEGELNSDAEDDDKLIQGLVDELATRPGWDNINLDADDGDNDKDTENVDSRIGYDVVKAPEHLNAKSLDQYRKDGPFGKLHCFGVCLSRSSQLTLTFERSPRSTG
ncbi:uncharacterized protein BCR38DRAFT_444876 [Pseudomassariella vexata]|uniref:Uncharacterized protein n=1 Tax=Pseudomassariella vexata TaxID=1141098 RepID=A0A1Y2DJY1_9PEZI|nr:uncharacterized protein BCR38DRAFT_444876 [Pseudomassariella vexata]ORY59557.1 hypothetical protein BCR38DRAFT_444876 [Pseudomassariella vexata]